MTDVRFAIRSLRKTPGFTALAVVTLALGIGANAAIFSLVHAVILKPLPYPDPARLVSVWDTYLPRADRLGLSITEFQALTEQRDLFQQTAWYRSVPFEVALTAPGAETLRAQATFASSSLFSMLAASPALGRRFAENEPPNSVILSQSLWHTRFNGNPAVAGQPVRLNGQDFTVIGVMRPEFRLPDFAELWLPNGPFFADTLTNPVRHGLAFVARLAPGATLAQAGARSQTLFRRLAAEHPKTSAGWGMKMAGLQEDLTGNIRPTLLMMLGAVTLVLLIACTNVANLLLSRASGRMREIAVRTALGAGAWRIVRQLLTESLLLSVTGAAVGLLLARAGLRLSPVAAPLDPAVLLFVLALSLATGVLFGLAPAVQALRTNHHSVIKSGTRAGTRWSLLRGSLVASEFALALILVAGAGMLMLSFLRLMRVPPGFEPRGLLTLRLNIPPSRDPVMLFHHLQEKIQPLPGVESVASVNALPLISNVLATASRFRVPGSAQSDPDALPFAQVRVVSPGYFRAMRIPLRSGRAFTEDDLTRPVAIVNESFARRYWPGHDPVGEKFVTGVWGPDPSWSTIVGVVGDVKDFGLDADAGLCEYFLGMASNYLVVRAGAPGPIAAAVRRAIHGVDSDLAVSELRTMDEVMAVSTRSRRWTMGLLGAFASLALLLALVGIYGVMAWAVGQRTREIGIRMALGANQSQALRMVIGDGLRLSGIGVAIGLAGAWMLRHVLASFVFGVSAADPLIYCLVVALMLAVAMLACYLPARRASRVDPSIALRWE